MILLLLIVVDVGVVGVLQSWQSHTETATSSLTTQKLAASDILQKYVAATQVISLLLHCNI